MSELRVATADPDGTRAVATAIARHLAPGDVVALSGELGAGKTCFVQGAAAALGITHPVTSPTFVLLHTYPGPVPVVHGDVYRLGTLRDVLDLGEEVFATDVVTFIEWGDAIAALLPDDRIEVVLTHADGFDDAHADGLDDAPADGLDDAHADGPDDTAEVSAGDPAPSDQELFAAPRHLAITGHGRHRALAEVLRGELAATGVAVLDLRDHGPGAR